MVEHVIYEYTLVASQLGVLTRNCYSNCTAPGNYRQPRWEKERAS